MLKKKLLLSAVNLAFLISNVRSQYVWPSSFDDPQFESNTYDQVDPDDEQSNQAEIITSGFVSAPPHNSGNTGNLDASIQSFSLDLFTEVTSIDDKKRDTILSPLSAQIDLSLVWEGAAGETAKQMAAALKISGTSDQVAASYRQLLTPLQNNDMLKIANKIYLAQGYEPNSKFSLIATRDYYAGVESINFLNANTAANKINRWVESKTNNLIHNLISPDVLDANTRMVLINAIYFKGLWLHEFKEVATTKNSVFHTSSTQQRTVDMMHQTNKFQYAQLPQLDASIIRLPYNNSDMSMLIILPNSVDGLPDVERRLKTIDLSTLSSGMREETVILSMPKFRTEYSINLNQALINIGMSIMFSNAADLSGLLASTERLHVTDVIQKAYIDVNEKGAEAAAATAVIVGRTLSIFQPPKPVEKIFNADHPFMYWIQNGDGDPIFLGHYLGIE